MSRSAAPGSEPAPAKIPEATAGRRSPLCVPTDSLQGATTRSEAAATVLLLVAAREGALVPFAIAPPTRAALRASCPRRDGNPPKADARPEATAKGKLAGTVTARGTGASPGVRLLAGGSARPCGLVLVAAKAKLDAAFLSPEVLLAAPAYWWTLSVPLSTSQMSLAFFGWMGIPVGSLLTGSIAQLPSNRQDARHAVHQRYATTSNILGNQPRFSRPAGMSVASTLCLQEARGRSIQGDGG
jgi:hypothetical protein